MNSNGKVRRPIVFLEPTASESAGALIELLKLMYKTNTQLRVTRITRKEPEFLRGLEGLLKVEFNDDPNLKPPSNTRVKRLRREVAGLAGICVGFD